MMDFLNPQVLLERFGVSPGMYVADLGSGPGFYVLATSKIIGDEGKVYAVDIQKEALSHLGEEARREGLNNIETIWGDIEKEGGSRLPDHHFDVVIVSNTLFQAEDKEGLAKEAYRILKGKGRLLVVDWEGSFNGLGPKPEDIVSEDKAKELFLKNGFEFLDSLDAGAYHYALSFRKTT